MDGLTVSEPARRAGVLRRSETVAGPELAALPTADAVIACSLDSADRDERAQSWRDVLTSVTRRAGIDGGVRLTVDRAGVDLGALAELAEAGARCCSFLDISMHLGPPLLLDVTAADDALALVHELVGEPA